MELSQLKYFLTTANCGKISQAAEILNVSQSAISMSISRLETELDIKLFRRQGRNIVLTVQGEKFADLISRPLSDLDFAEKSIRRSLYDEPDVVTLSVELPDLASAVEQIYMDLYPNARFRQSFDPSGTPLQKLLNDQVDFSLTFNRLIHSSITCIELMTEPSYAQMSSENEFAGHETLWLHELADQIFVSLSPEFGMRKWMENMCLMAGFSPDICYESCDTHTLMSFILRKNAISFIAESTLHMHWDTVDLQTHDDDRHLVYVPLKEQFCQRHVYVSYHNTRTFSGEAERFLDFLLEYRTRYRKLKNIHLVEETFLHASADT